MAIMTLLLSEYANEEIDVLKTMGMLLIHDLVEIDAGDTYAYDEEGKKTQHARETAAADRLFGMLPEDRSAADAPAHPPSASPCPPETRGAHAPAEAPSGAASPDIPR